MMNMNSVVVVGRLTKDPVLHETNDGKDICFLSLAVNRWTPGETNAVDFIPITLFGKAASSAGKYLVKGQEIGVKGRLSTFNRITPDGKNEFRMNVVAEHVEYGYKPNSSRQSPTNAGTHLDEISQQQMEFAEAQIPDDSTLPPM